MKIKIGTRGSELALWQANYIKAELETLGMAVELQIIQTKGDAIQHLSFDKIEGKGFFTKELEDALLAGDIDLAVHSMKDMPTTQPDGLRLAAVSYRDNPADWLIIRRDAYRADQDLKLPPNARVGTSSARRKAQLLNFRPDLELIDLRGNVPTRLKKLKDGAADAIMLAAAGLTRLQIDMSDFEVIKFSPREFVPAPAQGVLVLQIRKDDVALQKILLNLHQPEVSTCTNVERKILQLFGGGCHTPLGAYCECDQVGNYHVWAAIADTDLRNLQKVRYSGAISKGLAEQVVAQLQSVVSNK
jgi:hydroxymethylbilane synthase